MRMEMDDDFMGEIEFALSPEQSDVVNRAVNVASSLQSDDFAHINPLIAIVQWWQTHVPETERAGTTPEARLAEACKRYLAAHTA